MKEVVFIADLGMFKKHKLNRRDFRIYASLRKNEWTV